MQCFLTASLVPGEVIAAIDINTTANHVYQHNQPETTVRNNNIQRFTADEINKLGVNMILMSPPCQPFTRVGKKLDIDDNRSNALVHICHILPDLKEIDKILMENVKGFETSQARTLYVEALRKANFDFQEFLLSPAECVGVPNTRYRYYCLARKNRPFSFKSNGLLEQIPNSTAATIQTVSTVLAEANESVDNLSKYLLADDTLLKRVMVFDIKYSDSINTMCFTKAYTHYAEGTGSIYCPEERDRLDAVIRVYEDETVPDDEKLQQLRSLRLRYFTPYEVAKLMSFPKHFTFPVDTTNKQRYRVLGNSINVAVVAKLIELLCKN